MIRIIISLISILTITACGDKLEKLPKISSDTDLTKEIAHDVVIILSQKAKAKTNINAITLVRNETAMPPYAEMPDGVSADFFDSLGVVETHLTAKYAIYFDSKQNVLLKDSVVVTNKDGSQLITDELVWNNQMEKFYSDKQVTIIREGTMAFGEGLEANKDLTVVKIAKQTGIIPFDKDKMN